MSIQLMSQVFKMENLDLKSEDGKVVSASTAKFILLALADHANDQGEHVYPSIKLVSEKTGFSERTVITAMSALKNAGLLVKVGVSTLGTNEYRVEVTSPILNRVHPPRSEQGSPLNMNRVHSGHEQGSPKSSVKHQVNIIGEINPHPPLGENKLTYVETDDEGNELPPPKVKKGKGLYADEVTILAHTLGEVSGRSMDMKKNEMELRTAAFQLLGDKRISPELVRSKFGANGDWYKKDWRGKQGQKPTPFQVIETIFSFEDVRKEVYTDFKADDILKGRKANG